MPQIYAIGDLHLPVETQVQKFGCPSDYFDRISQHLLRKNPGVLLLAGDLAWGDDIEQVEESLAKIEGLPGIMKFFVEGNHDVWVDRLGDTYLEAQQKMYERFSTRSFYYIGGRALIVTLDADNPNDNDDGKKKVGICGARGYTFDPKTPPTEEDLTLRNNELESLSNALNQLKGLLDTEQTNLNLCVLHYPPTVKVYTNQRMEDEEFLTRIQDSGIIDKVVFGHIHVDDYLQLFTKLGRLELYCTTMDRRNYNAVKVFDSNL